MPSAQTSILEEDEDNNNGVGVTINGSGEGGGEGGEGGVRTKGESGGARRNRLGGR